MVIKAVVFDFGGVIMSYSQLPKLFMKIADDLGVDHQTFLSRKDKIFQFFVGDRRLMTGKITAEEFEEAEFLDSLNHAFGTNHKEPIRWMHHFCDPNMFSYHKPILNFIDVLRANGFKTGLLTNNFYIDK
ncbi:unnamed protein product, partial [Mesorhabditis spiculigera]